MISALDTVKSLTAAGFTDAQAGVLGYLAQVPEAS
jgi:hypothetical protein